MRSLLGRVVLNWERAVALWLDLREPRCNPLCGKECKDDG